MHKALSKLIDRLCEPELVKAGVIPWSCPVPSFGDLACSKIATLGLNPSNREFVDESGKELDGLLRRFHTLKSLGLQRWADATAFQLQLITESCRGYFSRNPYDGWFRKLDQIVSGTRSSFYNIPGQACHLDLIPYATERKWTELSRAQRSSLLTLAGDTLSVLLRDSPVRLLILNGNSVVRQFEEIANVQLERKLMQEWALPRRKNSVKGFAYKGIVRSLSGFKLDREIVVLGFNHNIQSSFGVTKQVTESIRNWISQSAGEVNL